MNPKIPGSVKARLQDVRWIRSVVSSNPNFHFGPNTMILYCQPTTKKPMFPTDVWKPSANSMLYRRVCRQVEGAYYLLLSLQNAIGVMRSVRDYLVEDAVKEHLNVPQITSDFRKEASDAKPNVLALTSATFAMMGGAVAPVAPVAGVAGFASGMLSAMGSADSPKPDETEDFEGKLADLVLKAFKSAQDKVDDIIGALVGEEGKDQELIPQEMRKQLFDNAAINALGDGQWLSDDPGQGVKESIETVYTKHVSQFLSLCIPPKKNSFYSPFSFLSFFLTIFTEAMFGLDNDPIWTQGIFLC